MHQSLNLTPCPPLLEEEGDMGGEVPKSEAMGLLQIKKA